MKQTAFITGANKGIGYETARQLALKNFHVFVGARNADAGWRAVDLLRKDGAHVTFVHCDVTEPESIHAACLEVCKHVDQIDVLVNNAAILEDESDSILSLKMDRLNKTLATNSVGPLLVSQVFHPLLTKSIAPRIINVSSGAGQLSEGMDNWAPAYRISKTALNAITCLLSASLPRFAVNSVCPGWVQTDMGGPGALRSAAEGADTIVWLATESPQELTGKFLRDRKPIPW